MRQYLLFAALAVLLVPPLLWGKGDDPKGKGEDKDVGKTFSIPYRLVDTSHIMVRVKINGKGPFNFIVDTGAPLVYVSTDVAKKIGITPEKKGQTKVDRFEIEGGPVFTDWKCMIDTPFQIEGMNALGAAGVELHGIMGYTMLSHFKMEIDLTRDKMSWTKLDYSPPAPQSLGVAGGGLDTMGKFMQTLAKTFGLKRETAADVRGYLGVELQEKDKSVVVLAVLPKSPAAEAGVQKGDRLLRVQNEEVASVGAVQKLLATVRAGQDVFLLVRRGDGTKQIKLKAGEGL
jgi:hypothetical protein